MWRKWIYAPPCLPTLGSRTRQGLMMNQEIKTILNNPKSFISVMMTE